MALGIVFNATEQTQQSFGNTLSYTSSAITTTTGDTVFAWVSWGNNTAGTNNTGDITAFSDSNGNTWNRIGSTFYTSGTTEGKTGLAVFWSHLTTGSAGNTWSFTISAGTWNTGTATVRFAVAGYSNVFTPFFDAVSTGATGTGTTLTTNSVTPTLSYDALLVIGTQGAGATQTMAAPNTSWTQRFTGSSGTFLQEVPFAGMGYSAGTGTGFFAGFNASPFSFQGTISGTVDWGVVIIGVPSTQVAYLAAADTVEPSPGNFQPIKELFFQGDIFLGGYTGLTFMKNVFVLPRDHWDNALSTPYSGQLFPTGGNSGGPGQVFPF